MIAVAIQRRRLRKGKSYEDFRKTWFHDYQPAAIDGTRADLTAVHDAIQVAGSRLARFFEQQTPQAPD